MTLIKITKIQSILVTLLTDPLYNYIYLIIPVIIRGNLKINFYWYILLLFTISKYSINLPGLSNSLSIIHPILLLYSLSSSPSYYKNNSIFLFWWLALFLGGWWASQEFNWGGWWNWDLIESPSFLLSLFLLYYMHNLIIIGCKFLIAGYQYQIIQSTIFVILNTRYISTSSIHSFVNVTNLFEYIYTLNIIFNVVVLLYWGVKVKSLFLLKLIIYICGIIGFKFVWLLHRFKVNNIHLLSLTLYSITLICGQKMQINLNYWQINYNTYMYCHNYFYFYKFFWLKPDNFIF